MNKKEFLRGLQTGLSYEMAEHEINEITADYSDIIDEKIADGNDEAAAVALTGSPATIVRTIISDVIAQSGRMAAISKRVGAHFVDSIITTLFVCVILFGAGLIYTNIAAAKMDAAIPATGLVQRTAYEQDGTVKHIEVFDNGKLLFRTVEKDFEKELDHHGLDAASIGQVISITYVQADWAKLIFITRFVLLFVLALILGVGNILNIFLLWLSNGYTIGKWLFHIKVGRTDGRPLTFSNVLLREVVIKILCNTITIGCANLFSLVWAAKTPSHKTLHDAAAKTKVTEVRR